MKDNSQFKTMRHIETVRNYLNLIIKRLLIRQEEHDQSKMQEPEISTFEKYTPKLRGVTYGSEEYRKYMKEMKPAIDHHNAVNRHHPEHFTKFNCNGCHKDFINMPDTCDICGYSQFQKESDISQMNLIDLIEMICDWKAATLRHADGDIEKSIETNQKRFGYSDELKKIFQNTARILTLSQIFHHAEES